MATEMIDDHATDTMGKTYAKTQKRTPTKRGVMCLGQTCNLRCYFCYFLERIEDTTLPEHAFMSLEKAKEICNRLRFFYGDTSIDIQGGEPTIFPGIFELISHCATSGFTRLLSRMDSSCQSRASWRDFSTRAYATSS